MTPSKDSRRISELPLGAPARRVRIDFGPAPIPSSAPPSRIIGSEPRPTPGYLVDN